MPSEGATMPGLSLVYSTGDVFWTHASCAREQHSAGPTLTTRALGKDQQPALRGVRDCNAKVSLAVMYNHST